MKPNHVPGFLMTHSALAVVLGLLCAWVIDLGNSAPVVVLGTGLGAGFFSARARSLPSSFSAWRSGAGSVTCALRRARRSPVGDACRQRWPLPRPRRTQAVGRQPPAAPP